MSSGGFFGNLGKVLAQGGEIALGMAFSSSADETRLEALYSRRFSDLSPTDISTLESFASQMVSAADSISGLDLDDLLPLSSIPVNPSLYGDDPGGRRIKVIGEVQFPDDPQWYQVRIDLPDNETLESTLEQIAELGQLRMGRYHPGLSDNDDDESNLPVARIKLIERRF